MAVEDVVNAEQVELDGDASGGDVEVVGGVGGPVGEGQLPLVHEDVVNDSSGI